MGLARRAADLGLAALDEIAFRRWGLVVALVVIAVLMLGLYLKSRALGVPGDS
ncbi:MAG: hypothetical protein QN187_01420 [Armatimonadota bacterium]|nr:hypothetical protein [Armatimonadota bacterium]MDR7520509.1 hypothetical protein [Armatimonadota bacterium]MDR7550210.1 hypothetical protein [Armatimonadota bacterium]